MNNKTPSLVSLIALIITCSSECKINTCVVGFGGQSSTFYECVTWSSGKHMYSTTYPSSTDCTRNMDVCRQYIMAPDGTKHGINCGPVGASVYPEHECCNKVETPSPTPFPTYDYANADDQVVDVIMQDGFFAAVTCQNEQLLWDTMAIMSLYPDFMDSVMTKTQKESAYANLRDYIYTLPIFYSNEDDCEVDYFIKDTLASIFGIGITSNANPETLLDNIYQTIKADIDNFGSKLSNDQKKTAIAVNYELEFCLDVGIDFCTKMGFGFAWNFNGEVVYYKLGSQALTLSMLDDFDVLPGSVLFEVSYDFLGEIGYAPGMWYSIDVGFSPGFIAKMASNYNDYISFMENGYGFSYLAGVDTLNLFDIDTAKCIGLSFGKSLTTLTGGIIPNVSFGMSRGVVKTIDDLSPPVAVNDDDPTTWCINEQLYSVTCAFSNCIVRPDIEW